MASTAASGTGRLVALAATMQEARCFGCHHAGGSLLWLPPCRRAAQDAATPRAPPNAPATWLLLSLLLYCGGAVLPPRAAATEAQPLGWAAAAGLARCMVAEGAHKAGKAESKDLFGCSAAWSSTHVEVPTSRTCMKWSAL